MTVNTSTFSSLLIAKDDQGNIVPANTQDATITGRFTMMKSDDGNAFKIYYRGANDADTTDSDESTVWKALVVKKDALSGFDEAKFKALLDGAADFEAAKTALTNELGASAADNLSELTGTTVKSGIDAPDIDEKPSWKDVKTKTTKVVDLDAQGKPKKNADGSLVMVDKDVIDYTNSTFVKLEREGDDDDNSDMNRSSTLGERVHGFFSRLFGGGAP